MERLCHWLRGMGWVMLALVAAAVLSGCASTDDSENLSERPWNAPRSWEHGLPSGMFEGR
ncbi:MAG TPA: hypothetical protein PKM73_08065 [Verrucomicrobiota bacterium]|nr:hypothetical protein [Verrucomicrobiota bacterium]HNU51676.1 hypothetical protein [Verrucomicrobiota bacterium]